MDIIIVIEIVLFCILMILSGFFSSSETSLFSLDERQLEQMRRDENPRREIIERLLSEPRRLIVTILIGNEFVNVAASVISAALVIDIVGAENKLINLFIMIPILLLVGEITPKTMAIKNNVAFASFQSPLLEWFAKLITPLRWIVRLIAELLTSMVVGKELSQDSIVTKDMVRTLAKEAVGDGVLDRDEARYIEQIFDFGNRDVEDLMTPRSNVFFLSIDSGIQRIVSELKRTRRTKIPIYKEHRDEILGILHARDLMAADLEALEADPQGLLALLREPYFVPETKSASDLFRTFSKRHLSVAIAVDEYGGVTGLISMEDLLECIFGDIPSPSDALGERDVSELADGNSQLDASLSIAQFNQQMHAELDEEELETIGGLVLHEFGELPSEGSTTEIDEFTFTVLGVEANRITTLSVTRKDSAPIEPMLPDESADPKVDSSAQPETSEETEQK